MKKIIFVRHGKAEEENHGMSDFERSLTTQGKKISKQMAGIFRDTEKSPGLLLSSPAFRALETALIFAGECGTGYDKVALDSGLYFKTNLEKVLELLSEKYEEMGTVTMFGHNPSFTDMADTLAKDGFDMVPKSGVVCLAFDVNEWKEISPSTGSLEYFLKPEKG
jgi:phosphohistidine phosphatase